jgi:hypothetical protein
MWFLTSEQEREFLSKRIAADLPHGRQLATHVGGTHGHKGTLAAMRATVTPSHSGFSFN